jgi:hypothetical protein
MWKLIHRKWTAVSSHLHDEWTAEPSRLRIVRAVLLFGTIVAAFGQWAVIGWYFWGIAVAGMLFLAHFAATFFVFCFYGLESGSAFLAYTTWILGYVGMCSSWPRSGVTVSTGWWLYWWIVSIPLYLWGAQLWKGFSGRRAEWVGISSRLRAEWTAESPRLRIVRAVLLFGIIVTFFGKWAVIGWYLWGTAAGTLFLAHVAVIFFVFCFGDLESGFVAFGLTTLILVFVGYLCVFSSLPRIMREAWPYGFSLLCVLSLLSLWVWMRSSGRTASLEMGVASSSARTPMPHSPVSLLTQLESGEFPKIAVHRSQARDEVQRYLVDCTVFAPDRVGRDQEALLQVLLHAPGDEMLAQAKARQFDPETKLRGHRSLVLDAPIGTTLSFDVQIEGFIFSEQADTLVWTGHPLATAFPFRASKHCKWGQHVGIVRILENGIPVGRIVFQVEVVRDTRGARGRPVGDAAQHYRSCFFSYSSLDRAEMIKRAQGAEAVGAQTFIDVLNLRPGDEWNPKIFQAIDESDVFVVIWSKNARDSKWVIKESRHALKRYKEHKSPDFNPIPIEGPPIAPVPRCLRGHHFNDGKLYMLRVAELEREKGSS